MPKPVFENAYKCSECGTEWMDRWCATCNDRCPKCDVEIEAYESFDTEETCEHLDC